jgi:peptidoglycan/xylan/chitin deacetylase (PgdA/CDA1 family)
VHCAVNLDGKSGNNDTIDEALDRALERGEVVELYAHKPGASVAVADIEHVLAGAQQRGLASFTYADFAHGRPVEAGLALSFDDSSVEAWYGLRAMFQQYGAHATFFITRYATFSIERRQMMRDLADDGHDLAAHSVAHRRAPTYVEDNGLPAYMKDEAIPSIEALRADGYDVTSYAYPYGARTTELDRELLRYVPVLRSVSFTIEGAPDPCPL